ncbi:MAG TPA: hypothetical protein VGI54_11145, partial [Solirubrobacteraceae bacterium]
ARELVAARLSSLGPETVSALRVAAVIGRTFDPVLVAAVEERSVASVLDALAVAGTAGLIEESEEGRYAFIHAVVQEAIHDGLPAGRRATLHAGVAAALEAGGGADSAELARHFLAAGARAQAVEYSLLSGDRALAGLAYEDAAAHYGNALAALGAADQRRRCDLLLALGDARARAGDTAACRSAYREAAALADSLGLPDKLARAAIGYGGRIIWEVSRDDPDVGRLLEHALARVGDGNDELRVRLLARLGAGPLRDDHDPTRRRAITREALAAARRLGDPATLAYALDGYIAAYHSPDHTVEQVDLATELIELSLAAGDLERAMEAYEHRAAARLELGDTRGAAADVETMAPLAAELRQPTQRWVMAERRAMQAVHEGRLAEAETLIAEALHTGSEAMRWNARTSYVLQLAALRHLEGRLAELESELRAAAEGYATSYPLCRCAYAQVLAAAGRRDQARRLVGELVADDLAALKFDETWLGAVAFLAEAAHALGDAAAAARIFPRLAPYADRVAMSTPEVALAGVPRYLGLLAAAQGRAEEAAVHFTAAVAFDTRVGARAFAALTLVDHAELTGDASLAGQARTACTALDMHAAAERSAALLP